MTVPSSLPMTYQKGEASLADSETTETSRSSGLSPLFNPFEEWFPMTRREESSVASTATSHDSETLMTEDFSRDSSISHLYDSREFEHVRSRSQQPRNILSSQDLRELYVTDDETTLYSEDTSVVTSFRRTGSPHRRPPRHPSDASAQEMSVVTAPHLSAAAVRYRAKREKRNQATVVAPEVSHSEQKSEVQQSTVSVETPYEIVSGSGRKHRLTENHGKEAQTETADAQSMHGYEVLLLESRDDDVSTEPQPKSESRIFPWPSLARFSRAERGVAFKPNKNPRGLLDTTADKDEEKKANVEERDATAETQELSARNDSASPSTSGSIPSKIPLVLPKPTKSVRAEEKKASVSFQSKSGEGSNVLSGSNIMSGSKSRTIKVDTIQEEQVYEDDSTSFDTNTNTNTNTFRMGCPFELQTNGSESSAGDGTTTFRGSTTEATKATEQTSTDKGVNAVRATDKETTAKAASNGDSKTVKVGPTGADGSKAPPREDTADKTSVSQTNPVSKEPKGSDARQDQKSDAPSKNTSASTALQKNTAQSGDGTTLRASSKAVNSTKGKPFREVSSMPVRYEKKTKKKNFVKNFSFLKRRRLARLQKKNEEKTQKTAAVAAAVVEDKSKQESLKKAPSPSAPGKRIPVMKGTPPNRLGTKLPLPKGTGSSSTKLSKSANSKLNIDDASVSAQSIHDDGLSTAGTKETAPTATSSKSMATSVLSRLKAAKQAHKEKKLGKNGNKSKLVGNNSTVGNQANGQQSEKGVTSTSESQEKGGATSSGAGASKSSKEESQDADKKSRLFDFARRGKKKSTSKGKKPANWGIEDEKRMLKAMNLVVSQRLETIEKIQGSVTKEKEEPTGLFLCGCFG